MIEYLSSMVEEIEVHIEEVYYGRRDFYNCDFCKDKNFIPAEEITGILTLLRSNVAGMSDLFSVLSQKCHRPYCRYHSWMQR